MVWKSERMLSRAVSVSASFFSSSSDSSHGDNVVADWTAMSSVFRNYSLLSAVVAFALAQFIKFFTVWYKERRCDPKQLLGSGGMPSAHSATVTALAIATGIQDGFGGSLFAASAILACVVMYDASGVRLHAGRQAEVLNQIVYELPIEHPLADTRPLHEVLGHTPLQVSAGSLLGLVVSVGAYWIKHFWTQI